MIINNEFTIAHYDGKVQLQLTSGPVNGITAGSVVETQYRRFIDNIKMIYGSQNPDGSIPTFFKNVDNTINSSSTLTSLQPNNSYYFISNTKDTNGNRIAFPYYVPAISGVSCGTTDEAVVNIDVSNINYIPDDSCTNPLPITATVSNAINGFSYSYIVSATGAGGTPTVAPTSGTITCNNDKPGSIPFTVLFNDANNIVVSVKLLKENNVICSDSSIFICGDQILPLPTNLSSQSLVRELVDLDSNKFGIQSSVNCPQEYTNTGKPDISFNHPRLIALSNSSLDNPIPVSVSIQNTKKDNYEYNYRFTIVGDTGNPVILPSSGSVYSNSYKCDTNSSFSSGNFTAMLQMNGAKNAVLDVKLYDKGKVLDNDQINFVYQPSDAPVFIDCPSISNNGNIIELNSPNTNHTNISNTISQLVPGRKYSYSFSGMSANWPSYVYPASGTFFADASTTTINNMFYFNSTTGCPDCFPYSTGIGFSDNISTKKFSIVKLSVKPYDPGCDDGTDKLINIYCNDCLVKPTPTITPTATATPTPTPTPRYAPMTRFVNGPNIVLNTTCCNEDVPVTIAISNAKPSYPYQYYLTASTISGTVNMIPSSGTVAFNNGAGYINTLVSLNNVNSTTIKIELKDGASLLNTDFVTISCGQSCVIN
jgi:hypothetical protein